MSNTFYLSEEAQQSSGGILAISINLPGSLTAIPHHQVYERWLDFILKIKPSIRQDQHIMAVYPAGCLDNDSLIDVHYKTTSNQLTVLDLQGSVPQNSGLLNPGLGQLSFS